MCQVSQLLRMRNTADEQSRIMASSRKTIATSYKWAVLTRSDFIQSPFPESLKDDEELDVVVMSFTLDDFCDSFRDTVGVRI